jgi:hypothetical protein
LESIWNNFIKLNFITLKSIEIALHGVKNTIDPSLDIPEKIKDTLYQNLIFANTDHIYTVSLKDLFSSPVTK